MNPQNTKPFSFQNQKSYQDLMHLAEVFTKKFDACLTDGQKELFAQSLSYIHHLATHIAYRNINEDNMVQMELTAYMITKIHDLVTNLDMLKSARALGSVQYFQTKQILEKLYWQIKQDQKSIIAQAKSKRDPACTSAPRAYQ